MKPTHLVILILLMFMVQMVPIRAQESFPVITVNYREIRLVPEDTTTLTSQHSVFLKNPSLYNILSSNSTIFWEAIGGINPDMSPNNTVSTFALVQINITGYFQCMAVLSHDNNTLVNLTLFGPEHDGEFVSIIESATDFFAESDHYWGLCEEIVIIPGTLVNLNSSYVWRLRFHLVAESERWTLFLNSTASILSARFTKIPCKACSNSLLVIIGVSGVVTIGILAVNVLFRKRQ